MKQRLFVGYLLNEAERQPFSQVQEKVNGLIPKDIRFKLVEVENLHLSLSFLGEVDQNQVEKVKKVLGFLIPTLRPPAVNLNRIELIPPTRPRILAYQTNNEKVSTQLTQLAQAINKNLADLGITARTKPPHLTLIRFKKPLTRQTVVKIRKDLSKLTDELPVTLDRIHLVESQLFPTGPQYQVLKTYSLKKA